MIYQLMLRQKHLLESELQKSQDELNQCPQGHLTYKANGSYTKWFHHINDNKNYIPTTNRELAVKLALKKYHQARIKDIQRQLKGIDAYLQTNDPKLDKAPALLQPSNRYSNLLLPEIRPISAELAQWAAAPYPKSNKFPEQLRFPLDTGLVVRSKSETMIAMKLSEYNIPFRYEAPLSLGPFIIHPDFTLRHPQTGETYYWEHAGKMDDPAYVDNFKDRIKRYIQNNIFPGDRLILTFETGNQPLTPSQVVAQIILHFST